GSASWWRWTKEPERRALAGPEDLQRTRLRRMQDSARQDQRFLLQHLGEFGLAPPDAIAGSTDAQRSHHLSGIVADRHTDAAHAGKGSIEQHGMAVLARRDDAFAQTFLRDT